MIILIAYYPLYYDHNSFRKPMIILISYYLLYYDHDNFENQ